jgi:hypothetical protein
VDLVDSILLGGAGIDLEDFLAQREGLGGDAASETLLGDSIGF